MPKLCVIFKRSQARLALLLAVPCLLHAGVLCFFYRREAGEPADRAVMRIIRSWRRAPLPAALSWASWPGLAALVGDRAKCGDWPVPSYSLGVGMIQSVKQGKYGHVLHYTG